MCIRSGISAKNRTSGGDFKGSSKRTRTGNTTLRKDNSRNSVGRLFFTDGVKPSRSFGSLYKNDIPGVSSRTLNPPLPESNDTSDSVGGSDTLHKKLTAHPYKWLAHRTSVFSANHFSNNSLASSDFMMVAYPLCVAPLMPFLITTAPREASEVAKSRSRFPQPSQALRANSNARRVAHSSLVLA